MSIKPNIDNMLYEIAHREGMGGAMDYFRATINAESSGNGNNAVDKKIGTSKSFFGTTDPTFRHVVRRNKEKFPAITSFDDASIDKFRFIPEYEILVGVLYTKENSQGLGGTMDARELYQAHFAGLGGAKAIKSALAVDPNTPLKNVLSAESMKKNGVVTDEKTGKTISEGIRMKLDDGSKLYFADFTVANFSDWAGGKVNQKARYDGTNPVAPTKYQKNKDGVPEAEGNIVEMFITILASLLKGAGKMLAGLFSGSSQDNSQLAKLPPKTDLSSKTNSILNV